MRVSYSKLPQTLGFFISLAVFVFGAGAFVSACAEGSPPAGPAGSGGGGGSGGDGGGEEEAEVPKDVVDADDADAMPDVDADDPEADADADAEDEPVSVCGNDIVEPGEDCDGEDLAGQSCLSLNFIDGDLACSDGCSFDTDECGARCEFKDLGVWKGTTIKRKGDDMCGDDNRYNGVGCTGTNSGGGEVVYAITVPAKREITVSVTPQGQSLSVWVSTTCADFKPTSCVGATSDPAANPIKINNNEEIARTYFIVVDPNSGVACRNFDLEVTGIKPVGCGNDLTGSFEECDGSAVAPGFTCKELGFGPGNVKCTPICTVDACIPLHWHCDPSTYDAGDGCDCGCGALDPDCPNSEKGSCDKCDETEGLCAEKTCNEITPGMNWRCGPPPECNDGIIDIEAGELCDGTDVGTATCESIGFGSGDLKCKAGSDCKEFDTDDCNPCGNGTIQPGEDCDGTNLNSQSCKSQGFTGTGGSLTCSSDCTLNTSACSQGSVPAYFLPCGSEQELRIFKWPGPLAIPNNGAASEAITAPVTVPTNRKVAKAAVLLNIEHGWISDLQIKLIPPSGTEVELCMRKGGNNSENFTETIFDSTCTSSSITVISEAGAPFSKCYSPEMSLEGLNEKSPFGTWALSVRDPMAATAGTLLDWSLLLCVDP